MNICQLDPRRQICSKRSLFMSITSVQAGNIRVGPWLRYLYLCYFSPGENKQTSKDISFEIAVFVVLLCWICLPPNNTHMHAERREGGERGEDHNYPTLQPELLTALPAGTLVLTPMFSALLWRHNLRLNIAPLEILVRKQTCIIEHPLGPEFTEAIIRSSWISNFQVASV